MLRSNVDRSNVARLSARAPSEPEAARLIIAINDWLDDQGLAYLTGHDRSGAPLIGATCPSHRVDALIEAMGDHLIVLEVKP